MEESDRRNPAPTTTPSQLARAVDQALSRYFGDAGAGVPPLDIDVEAGRLRIAPEHLHRLRDGLIRLRDVALRAAGGSADASGSPRGAG